MPRSRRGARARPRPSRRSRARRRRGRGRGGRDAVRRDFQRTPTTTQSAVFSGFTFTTPSREPGRREVAALRDHAVEPDRLEALEPAERLVAIARGRRARSASRCARGALALRERLVPGLDAFQTSTSKATKRAGISADSLFTRLSAGWSRICIASKSRTPSRSMTISPSSADSGGSSFSSGRSSGK